MDFALLGDQQVKTTLITAEIIASYEKTEGLLIGVVKAAQTSRNNSCTIITIQAGADETLFLFMKNNAGFLVGRIIVIDSAASMVRWIDNPSYAFSVLAALRVPQGCSHDVDRVKCPECENIVRIERLPRHLEHIHDFTILQYYYRDK